MENIPTRKTSSRIWAGIILLGIGGVLLLSRMGFFFPGWLFRWPLILIIIGLFDGLRNQFRGGTWLVLLLIGGFFLLDDLAPGWDLGRFTWPLIIIAVGAGLLLRPNKARNRYQDRSEHNYLQNATTPQSMYPEQAVSEYRSDKTTGDDFVDAVSIFGATRKIVVSKNFQGGDLVSLFGGHEIDLRQADIHGSVVLDVTQIFGGTKLILPSNWHVKSEMVALLGGIEDKRQMSGSTVNPDKILILKGTSIFGGIDIRNY